MALPPRSRCRLPPRVPGSSWSLASSTMRPATRCSNDLANAGVSHVATLRQPATERWARHRGRRPRAWPCATSPSSVSWFSSRDDPGRRRSPSTPPPGTRRALVVILRRGAPGRRLTSRRRRPCSRRPTPTRTARSDPRRHVRGRARSRSRCSDGVQDDDHRGRRLVAGRRLGSAADRHQRFDQLGTVAPHVVDDAHDRRRSSSSTSSFGTRSPSSSPGSPERRIEPAVPGVVGEDDRHPVVEVGDAPRSGVVVTIVKVRRTVSVAGSFQPAHRPASASGRPSSRTTRYGWRIVALPLPLVERIDRDEAALALERVAEGRTRRDRLGARVEHPRADLRLGRPVRDQAPAVGRDGAALVALDDDQRPRRSGRRCSARRDRRRAAPRRRSRRAPRPAVPG